MNKKLLTTIVMSTVLASAFAVNAGATADKKVLKDEQGNVHNVVGKLGHVTGATAEDRAFAALEKVKGDFGFATATGNFKVKSSDTDEVGATHTKMNQVIGGIPVYGSQMIVHEQDSNVSGVTGSFKNLQANATTAAITESAAIEAALAGDTADIAPTAELVYLPQGDQALLTYKIDYSVLNSETPARYNVFVSALDGQIVTKLNNLHMGTAAVGTGIGVLGDTKYPLHTELINGSYYLNDISKPMYTGTKGIIRTRDMRNGTSMIYNMTDADNVWNTSTQRPAVDAHFYAGTTYNWYKNHVNRNSIDDAGGNIESLVHYGSKYNNAFWNGTYMVYGDGDGTTFLPFSGALDIVAHELTHGVMEQMTALIYQDQSGALSESWSDSLACVIEGKNWTIGEDIYTPGIPGDALRSLSSPSTYGDPEHMSQYVYTTANNGGVDTNSGIPNKAFYRFATTIGDRNIAGKVWYVAARDYMTPNTNFSGARAATMAACNALYGSTSSTCTALANAWDTVGVY